MPLATKKTHLNILSTLLQSKFNCFTITNFIWDIEKNPGPASNYTDVLKHVKQTEDQLKFKNLICRSLNCQRGDLKILLGDSGHNTIIGLPETWLSSENDSKLWEIDGKKPLSFRRDRNLSEISKKRGGGVMLLVPKCLKPRIRNDLKMNTSFEALLLEISLVNIELIVGVGVVYSPQKNLSSEILDELVFKIDKVFTMGCKFVLMGDFNINYLNMNEKSFLNTNLTPYSLQPCNQSVPTMQNFTSLIDYIITDDTSDKHRTKIFKTYIKSDHFATILFSNLE